MSNARVDQLIRESFVQGSPNVRVDQLVRECWISIGLKRVIVGGLFQDPRGNPLAGGRVTFRLSTDAVASGFQVVSAVLTSADLDANGSISGIVSLWPNDLLTPTDTVYRIKAYTAAGQLVWESENVIPSGIGTFDIGTLTPLVY